MISPMGRTLGWATDAVAARARVMGVKSLREGAGPWLIRFEVSAEVVEVVLRVGEVDSAADHQQFGTEVAALKHAENHRLAAPRLIALDLDGDRAGVLAVLTTVLPGSSRIPLLPSENRMRRLGAAAAGLHAIEMAPQAGLPLRKRPLADVDFSEARRTTGTSALLTEAETRVSRTPAPEGKTVFVHGDLWQGNTMWIEDTFVGVLDWDAAGAGSYGVDLGSLRCDVAITFGLPAAEQVLEGWQEAIGRQADDLAYWDVIAALSTPTDMIEWLPTIHEQGRIDLNAQTLTDRRDAFLRTALDRLPPPRSPSTPDPAM
ncbi:aminoglycoside phosphotransferase family protein [Streptosporangium subroseum]|uniref:aminoglycoside phosphotransferase family protein n=1 Tax=Streptosporangium subroseum TaxID=106412 RepID=UPI003419F3D9